MGYSQIPSVFSSPGYTMFVFCRSASLRRPDITKARAELGYDPNVPLTEGIKRTLEWYRYLRGMKQVPSKKTKKKKTSSKTRTKKSPTKKGKTSKKKRA